jgi:hypothetical protein
VHAFGVDTQRCGRWRGRVEREWDFVFVGSLVRCVQAAELCTRQSRWIVILLCVFLCVSVDFPADTEVRAFAFCRYKRPWMLLDKPGRRLALSGDPGSDGDDEQSQIRRQLVDSGVTVQAAQGFDDMCQHLAKARAVYLPCTTFGGGERAVLEARAAGAEVLVEADNAKLRQLRDGPLYDSSYYATQLRRVIGAMQLKRPECQLVP